MPPRSKILPQSLSEGYQNSQRLKYGFLKVGKEATTIAGTAGWWDKDIPQLEDQFFYYSRLG